MATEIKRVRFFDGQFLKELEFRDEQAYHQHLRRRMNFFLFGTSGVVQIGADDLRFFDPNNTDKTFRVHAGMAICRRPLLAEGKEIVLFVDSPVIDLDAAGIVAGGTAFVTIHYEEEEAKDPASEGDVDENTRVKEKAVLQVHSSLPAGPAPNGEEFILLGTIAHTGMGFDYTARQEAKLRASLLSAPVLPLPSIISLTGTIVAAPGGAPVVAVINGTNLTGASAVAFSDPAVTAVINAVPLPTSIAVSITVTVGLAAAPGPKSFSITTPGGTANSPGPAIFTVTGPVALPTITGITVHTGVQGGPPIAATITGNNLLGATVAFSGTLVTASPLPGTAIALPISINVALLATVGARTFTVTTPGGMATSAGVVGADFTVTPAPVITIVAVLPGTQTSPNAVSIRGLNIRNPAIVVPGSIATGTEIRFVNAVTPATVLAGPFTPTVLADAAGNQVVTLPLPAGGAFAPPQPPASSLTVKVRVDFGGVSGVSPMNLIINFP